VTELDLTLADGRTLHVYDEGDPSGVAVVAHHGTPASGRLHPEISEDARARGIRLIGYDRPGYGVSSSAQPGRTVGDAAADVAELLDQLDANRFATWGHSGGGPHSLACAALLPERCVAAAALSSPGPYGAEGLDFLEGMGELNTQEFDAVLAGTEALEPALRREQEMFSAGPEGLREGMLTILSPVDQEAFTAEVGDWIYAVMKEGGGERIEGWRDDSLAFVAPWGFEPSDINVPVLVLHGVHDLMAPPAHGRWLAAQIPGAEAEISDAEGHITLYVNRIPEVHAWLLQRF
jgi:pimeloyl-ACP methyl ester carboxylesterase